jgi:hypothetical protein
VARVRPPGDRLSSLYLASSSQGEIAALARRLADLFGAHAPAGASWHYEAMPEESHATVYHPAALRAFRHLFRLEPKPQ